MNERLRSESYLKEPKCIYCKHELEIDDIECNFEGCQDEWWICPHCGASLRVKVRYNKVVAKLFEKGENHGKETKA